ncbi:MAG: hypothetical protein NTX59_01700 [Elusimicrobia bacterium]|nr:hypothetical protein [Elusimicrobiota bacterium]
MAFLGKESGSGLRPKVYGLKRRGQTAIEYLLVTVSLLVVFVFLYKSLQWYLSGQFKSGGIIVMKMYKQDPN